jgi:hypothetical protein
MDGLPSPWTAWEQQAKAFQHALDDLGDATLILIERTVKSDERLRLEQEAEMRVQHIASDLRGLAVVVDDAYNLSRHLRVLHREDPS